MLDAIVIGGLAVGISEKIDRVFDDSLEVCPPGLDLALRRNGVNSRKDRMILRMCANDAAVATQITQSLRGQHQIVGKVHTGPFRNCVNSRLAFSGLEALKLWKNRIDRIAAIAQGCQRVLAKIDILQIQDVCWGAADRFDHRVVEHPATVQKTRRDEECRGNAVAPQYRQG